MTTTVEIREQPSLELGLVDVGSYVPRRVASMLRHCRSVTFRIEQVDGVLRGGIVFRYNQLQVRKDCLNLRRMAEAADAGSLQRFRRGCGASDLPVASFGRFRQLRFQFP